MKPAGLSTYIVFCVALAASCDGKEDSSSKVLDDIPVLVRDLAGRVAVGPEFEFDVPDKGNYTSAQAWLYVENLRHQIEKTLQHYGSKESTTGRYVLDDSFASRYGMSSVEFHVNTEYQKILNAPVLPDFQENKMASFYSLSLFPTKENVVIVKPVVISYTSKAALFEIKVSALNTKQIEKIGELLEAFIFESTKYVGLVPPELGSGRIHMGLDSFKEVMQDDLKKVTVGLYNYLKSMYENDRFMQVFMRPDSTHAITPSMVSDEGRRAVTREFNQWLQEIQNRRNFSDLKWFEDWLAKRMDAVTMADYLNEITNGEFHEGWDSFKYYRDWDSAKSDFNSFRLKPEGDRMVGAFGFNATTNTLETRALKSQKSIYEFIRVSEFLTRLLVGSSKVAPSPLLLIDESLIYRQSVPVPYIEEQTRYMFDLANYDLRVDGKEFDDLIISLDPRVQCGASVSN